MEITNLQQIEQAISSLSPVEYHELLDWLSEHTPDAPIDVQLKADLDAGRLDDLIDRAVTDYQTGRTTPL